MHIVLQPNNSSMRNKQIKLNISFQFNTPKPLALSTRIILKNLLADENVPLGYRTVYGPRAIVWLWKKFFWLNKSVSLFIITVRLIVKRLKGVF